jgi:nucleoside 2-deoxyribosyltransferase
MTTIYVAGPMTGIPEHNYPAFDQAETDLRAAGYDVLNPVASEQHNTTGQPQTWRWYMRHSIPMVAAADGIALLPGWENSSGAQLEVHIAEALDLPTKALDAWTAVTA